MSDRRRLEVAAEWADQESRVLLDRVHAGDPYSFAELTDLAYALQGVATFCRATGVEPESVDVNRRNLRLIK